MAYNKAKKNELYNMLINRGYDENFCKIISDQMCTEWTATRMIGYLTQGSSLRPEDIVDEMLAIMEDRERIIRKHELEDAQSVINGIYRYGLAKVNPHEDIEHFML